MSSGLCVRQSRFFRAEIAANLDKVSREIMGLLAEVDA